jgi:hypothetical protein
MKGGQNIRKPIRLGKAHRAFPVILGVVTLTGVGVLVVWDLFPRLFSAGAHKILASFPLATIAFAYLLYQTAHRPARVEFVKAILLAIAFLFWAANQLWPDFRQATLFNDIAIALFVLDVFLVIVGWPATSPDESFADTFADPSNKGAPQDDDEIPSLNTSHASSKPHDNPGEKETGG